MNQMFQRVEADLSVSVTDFKRNPSAVFEQAKQQAIAVLSHGHVLGYVISPIAYDGFLEAVEDLQDVAEIERTKNEKIVPVDLHDL
jgi:antitoxin StbD